MRTWILLCVVAGLTLCNSLSFTQEIQNEKKLNCDYEACNCVFVELAGNGVFLSLNVEHLFSRKFGLRAGVGATYGAGVSIPLLVSWYNGEERKFELGIGLTFMPLVAEGSIFGGSKQPLLITSAIAVKFQPRFGGLMVRFAATPLYNISINRFIPYGGVSIGVAF